MKLNKKVFEIIDSGENVEDEFEDIKELSRLCKFADCTHTTEPGCAVEKAISEGILSREIFNNYYAVKNEAKYVSNQKNKTKAIDYVKQNKYFRKD